MQNKASVIQYIQCCSRPRAWSQKYKGRSRVWKKWKGVGRCEEILRERNGCNRKVLPALYRMTLFLD